MGCTFGGAGSGILDGLSLLLPPLRMLTSVVVLPLLLARVPLEGRSEKRVLLHLARLLLLAVPLPLV